MDSLERSTEPALLKAESSGNGKWKMRQQQKRHVSSVTHAGVGQGARKIFRQVGPIVF